jgi:hypothetical protein
MGSQVRHHFIDKPGTNHLHCPGLFALLHDIITPAPDSDRPELIMKIRSLDHCGRLWDEDLALNNIG